MKGTFVLKNVGPANRFRFHLETPDGTEILRGQLRQMKPMSNDEIRWIRNVAPKGNFYQRMKGDGFYQYILRAGDTHELGRGRKWDTAEEMEAEIAEVMKYASDAEFHDETPEEQYVRIHDYVTEESEAFLNTQGLSME